MILVYKVFNNHLSAALLGCSPVLKVSHYTLNILLRGFWCAGTSVPSALGLVSPLTDTQLPLGFTWAPKHLSRTPKKGGKIPKPPEQQGNMNWIHTDSSEGLKEENSHCTAAPQEGTWAPLRVFSILIIPVFLSEFPKLPSGCREKISMKWKARMMWRWNWVSEGDKGARAETFTLSHTTLCSKSCNLCQNLHFREGITKVTELQASIHNQSTKGFW